MGRAIFYLPFFRKEIFIIASQGRGAKVKGASFERKIAKAFTQWYNHDGVEFYRTPNSGAWSSTHMGEESQSADIVAPLGVEFPFSVELKNHEGFTFENYLMCNKEIPSFWNQCIGDARRVNKLPMLITHRNRSTILVTIPYASFVKHKLSLGNAHWAITEMQVTNPLSEQLEKFNVISCPLEEFFNTFKLEELTKEFAKGTFSRWDRYQNQEEVSR